MFVQDKKIDELRRSLQRYKKIQEMVMSAQGRKGMSSCNFGTTKRTKLHSALDLILKEPGPILPHF